MFSKYGKHTEQVESTWTEDFPPILENCIGDAEGISFLGLQWANLTSCYNKIK